MLKRKISFEVNSIQTGYNIWNKKASTETNGRNIEAKLMSAIITFYQSILDRLFPKQQCGY